MFKKLLAFALALFAAAAMAASVDVNKATQAELDGVKGIGPGIAGKIMEERKKAAFKDWPDFIERVKGVGEGNAAKFSAEGLTVNGASFKGAAPAPAAAKKDDKPAAKAAEPAKTAAPAPAAAPAKAEDKKAAAPAAAAPTPAASTAAEKKAAKDAKKAEKAAAKSEKADKAKAADAKASDAKPAKK